MLKKQSIGLSFKGNLSKEEGYLPTPTSSSEQFSALTNLQNSSDLISETDQSGTQITTSKPRNCWSGYHVKFRNPRKFEEFAIDKTFNRWGDMVEYFKSLDKPYGLSEGSLKDLLYGTYKRKGKHSLSLNDLVSIEKIDRQRKTKPTVQAKDNVVTKDLATKDLHVQKSLITCGQTVDTESVMMPSPVTVASMAIDLPDQCQVSP